MPQRPRAADPCRARIQQGITDDAAAAWKRGFLRIEKTRVRFSKTKLEGQLLQDSPLAEAHVAAGLAEDDVVEEHDTEVLAGGGEPVRKGDVLGRRFRIARRVAMRDDQRGGSAPSLA